jgi:hypothetical protein
MEQIIHLIPILWSANDDIISSLSSSPKIRKVIIITPEVLRGRDHCYCHCYWDSKDTLTELREGDAFIVKDLKKLRGYRVGQREFYRTHQLV